MHALSKTTWFLTLAFSLAVPGSTAHAAAMPGTIDQASCDLRTYPPEAARRGQEGTVDVALHVDQGGTVREAKLVRSSLHPRLDALTMDIVKTCKVAPPRQDGKAVAGWATSQFVWKLEGPARPAPGESTLSAAPAAFRTFLAKAKAAAGLADPLQRCLSFPDYPGSLWPRATVQAHCALVAEQGMSVSSVEQHIKRDELALLEGAYAKSLARHFDKEAFSEAIHQELGNFDSGPDAARVSSLWLSKAPGSAFAMAARAQHLLAWVQHAKYNDRLKPSGDFDSRLMLARLSEARALYEKSLAIESRLLPALLGLAGISQMLGEDEHDYTFKRAQRIDAGCYHLAQLRLEAISTDGGDERALHAYVKQLQPLLANRPLLATLMHVPALRRAEGLAAKSPEQAKELVREAALAVPSFEALDTYADSVAPDQEWDSLLAHLAAGRFAPDGESLMAQGVGLFGAGEHAWAAVLLEGALRSMPTNEAVRLWLGLTTLGSGEWEKAEQYLTPAFSDPQLQRWASGSLMRLMAQLKRWDAADALSLAYVARYPDDPLGWSMRGDMFDRLAKPEQASQAWARFRELALKKGTPDMLGAVGKADQEAQMRRQPASIP